MVEPSQYRRRARLRAAFFVVGILAGGAIASWSVGAPMVATALAVAAVLVTGLTWLVVLRDRPGNEGA